MMFIKEINKRRFFPFLMLSIIHIATLKVYSKVITADFSSSTIQKRDIVLSLSGITYNSRYGESWIMHHRGSSNIIGKFEISSFPSRAILIITHLSSASSRAKGGGYSPIDIIINGRLFERKYDVAENHNGSHSYNTDRWEISKYLQNGINKIEIKFNSEAQTYYWIQRLKIELEEKEETSAFKPSGATIGLPEKKTERWEEIHAGQLDHKLVCSSYMENYRYYDIFLIRSLMYLPEDRRVEITISNIEPDFRDRSRFLISFENIPVNKVEINGKPCIKRGDSFLYGKVNWYSISFRSPLRISVYLDKFSGQKTGFITLIATDPSLSKRIFDQIARKLYSPVISIVKLLGVADKGGIAFAKFAIALDLENPANCKVPDRIVRLFSTKSKVKGTIENVLDILSNFSKY